MMTTIAVLGKALDSIPKIRPHNTAKARAIVETKIRDIEARIRDLVHMRDELITIGRACGCGKAQPVCRVLEYLEYPAEQTRKKSRQRLGGEGGRNKVSTGGRNAQSK
jgi:hypothetical protein